MNQMNARDVPHEGYCESQIKSNQLRLGNGIFETRKPVRPSDAVIVFRIETSMVGTLQETDQAARLWPCVSAVNPGQGVAVRFVKFLNFGSVEPKVWPA